MLLQNGVQIIIYNIDFIVSFLRDLRGFSASLSYYLTNEDMIVLAFEGFVFSDETSDLSDDEYRVACRALDAIGRLIADRTRDAISHPEEARFFLPDEGWHPDSQPSFELDGSTKNAQTSYNLLALKDRDIIKKMRLYCHAFTGYQLATLEFAANRPWVSEKLPDNWDDTLRRLAGPPDQSVFDYVRVSSALPDPLKITPPKKFGEIGWLWDGKIINTDTEAYLERLCLMEENGVLDRLTKRQRDKGIINIVEIGGGYGGLAYFLSLIFGENVQYTIVDIPESLAFSAIYLSTLLPQVDHQIYFDADPVGGQSEPGFTYLSNTLCSAWTREAPSADLVINTLSLSEMSDRQIEVYCKHISSIIGDTGMFFEQNHQTDHQGPGGIPPAHFNNRRKCQSEILGDSYPQRRGQANLWVNPAYRG